METIESTKHVERVNTLICGIGGGIWKGDALTLTREELFAVVSGIINIERAANHHAGQSSEALPNPLEDLAALDVFYKSEEVIDGLVEFRKVSRIIMDYMRAADRYYKSRIGHYCEEAFAAHSYKIDRIGPTPVHTWLHTWEPHSQTREAMQGNGAHSSQTAAHRDDVAVDFFALAMKSKMASSRAKGRSGWDDPLQCPTERLQDMLAEHLHKGDPVDVGNLAMMLYNRKSPTVKADV